MARTLATHGAQVFSSDIEPHEKLDAVFDFLGPGTPDGLGHVDGTITNSPWGFRNRTAVAFIERGLQRIAETGGFLALLLPTDFDSAVTRLRLFQHPFFAGRIILTDRPVWFERTDGGKEQPKENCCWALWVRPVLRNPAPPVVRYAVARAPKRRSYDSADDVQHPSLKDLLPFAGARPQAVRVWIGSGDVATDNKIFIKCGGTPAKLSELPGMEEDQ